MLVEWVGCQGGDGAHLGASQSEVIRMGGSHTFQRIVVNFSLPGGVVLALVVECQGAVHPLAEAFMPQHPRWPLGQIEASIRIMETRNVDPRSAAEGMDR